MQRKKRNLIARNLAEADLLGHKAVEVELTEEQLSMGTHFFVSGNESGVICWTGLCGDPEPGYRYVKYTDENGLCNVMKKQRCP